MPRSCLEYGYKLLRVWVEYSYSMILSNHCLVAKLHNNSLMTKNEEKFFPYQIFSITLQTPNLYGMDISTYKSSAIELTFSQKRVLKQMMQFVNAPSLRVFILKGYAGTGKTTLMRFLIQELIKQDKGYRLCLALKNIE